MDWKSWFADYADYIPKAIHVSEADGAQKGFWEAMYQAFKARMLEEMGEERK
jgi:hypothetical protein